GRSALGNARLWRRGLATTLALAVCTAWIVPQITATSSLPSSSFPRDREQLVYDAQEFEKRGEWAKACRKYVEFLRKDRGYPEIRQRLQRCFRREQQVRRHNDPSYLKQVVALEYSDAVNLYRIMLAGLRDHYVDQVNPDGLFKRGLEEFRTAVENKVLYRYLPEQVNREQLCRGFVAQLTKWEQRTILSIDDAERQVREVAMLAQRPIRAGGLDLNATVVVLEFACGACTALDEYTFYLTPG